MLLHLILTNPDILGTSFPMPHSFMTLHNVTKKVYVAYKNLGRKK